MEHTSLRFAETRLSDGNVVRLGERPAELRLARAGSSRFGGCVPSWSSGS